MHLTIRADGGPDIGFGHLVRTGALATCLLGRGHSVTYATTTPAQVRSLCPDRADVLPLESRGNPDPFSEWLSASGTDAVVTDAYPVDTAYQRTIRRSAPLCVIQDDDRHAVCADVFVNGNLYATELDYDYVGVEPEWCLGPDYLLLREEIATLASREPPFRNPPERAIVTMGGSDVAGLTPDVVRAFDGLDLAVDVVVGPGFSNEDEIRAAAARTDVTANVIRNPPDLPERMFTADIGVSACGSTTYELLALGTPFVCIPVADNQSTLATVLDERNAATVLPRGAGTAEVGRALETLFTDDELRGRRRRDGRALVDASGTGTLSETLTDLHGGRLR